MAETDSLLQRLAIYRGNLTNTLLKQRAFHGSLTPPGVINGIADARNNINQLKAALYRLGVQTTDIPGVDYDIDTDITITVSRSVYEQMRSILEPYGIELPEVE